MKWIVTSLVIMISLVFAGCKDKSADEVSVKSVEKYKQQADKEITAENVDQELQKLEKSIDADAQ
ncbi:MAG: hypothetical protein PHF37_02600 [Phycisphaerae bacterium]|nr:hypothetical protein [Phycisphaerae bacterium]